MYISFALGSQREAHFQWNIGGVGPQRKIFALGMYISCCLCQLGDPTQTRFSVEYGLKAITEGGLSTFIVAALLIAEPGGMV